MTSVPTQARIDQDVVAIAEFELCGRCLVEQIPAAGLAVVSRRDLRRRHLAIAVDRHLRRRAAESVQIRMIEIGDCRRRGVVGADAVDVGIAASLLGVDDVGAVGTTVPSLFAIRQLSPA